MYKKKVLVLSPHTDDGELGCGGAIARYIDEGVDIHYSVFSMCEKSIPEGFPRDSLKTELLKAMEVLGIPRENIHMFDYDVREFPRFRQSILEDIVLLRDEIKPNIIFTPSSTDIHQDHKVISEETLRAFRTKSILGYEEPWNNITFNTNALMPLEKKHIEKKVEALNCYETQKHRAYLTSDFIFSLARARGTQIEREYAEAFEVIRWVLH